jgi:hypothetical protein
MGRHAPSACWSTFRGAGSSELGCSSKRRFRPRAGAAGRASQWPQLKQGRLSVRRTSRSGLGHIFAFRALSSSADQLCPLWASRARACSCKLSVRLLEQPGSGHWRLEEPPGRAKASGLSSILHALLGAGWPDGETGAVRFPFDVPLDCTGCGDAHRVVGWRHSTDTMSQGK